jgi:hypothetical protein
MSLNNLNRFGEIAKQAPPPPRIQQQTNVIIPQFRQELFGNGRSATLNMANRLKKVKINVFIIIIINFFVFSEVLIIDVVLIIMLFVNIKLLEHNVFFNVLVLVIEDVVVVLILIYSVDKVEWEYDFEDKVELEVCLTKYDYFYIYIYLISTYISFSNTWLSK